MQMRALPCRAGRPPPAATTTGKRAVAVVCTHLPAPLPPVGCRGGPAEAGRRPGVACAVSLTDTPSSSPAAAAAVVQPGAPPATTTSAPPTSRPIAGGTAQLNQHIREGHYESALATLQARKADAGQASIASVLPPVDPSVTVDVTVVGAGPAGLFLAAELGRRGLSVNVLGLDGPIVNNYGVWMDEFTALGMQHTVDCSWPDAVCYFGEGNEVRVGRPYGRVSRRKLREHLLKVCLEAGVRFSSTEVADISVVEGGSLSQLVSKDGTVYRSRLVTLAAGAAAGKFLSYEEEAPVVASQTAYGIEAEVEGYDGAYPSDLMLFMDFRRHHTGLYDATAGEVKAGKHPNSGDGIWGSSAECPSFLYAMPLGGKRVFLEETCLVAKPALPFAVLKRRLTRRLKAMGISVTKIHEEEWSYIPVGGPLPLADPTVTAFGAAANLVHPATGFSVSRSFREAPRVADRMVQAIRAGLPVTAASQQIWEQLWPQEKRTQASFHVFGMELLATLDVAATNEFFGTFFRLPPYYWRGFLASTLTATDLISFAAVVFVLAPPSIKYKLMEHLITDPAGVYLVRAYKALWDASQQQQQEQQPAAAASTSTAVAG